jgi:nitroreductase
VEVRDALATRKSVRAFLPTPVPRDVLEQLFTDAQRAPSWCNIQPWRVYLTGGEVTRRLTAGMVAAARAGSMKPDFKWPGEYPEPYNTHRRECGRALYSAMGVARDDGAGRMAAWMRNYEAFGAPHVGIVCMDRRWDLYAAIDIGCWLQSLMLAAVDRGLGVCAQASLGTQPQVAREVLGIPDGLGVLFGVSLGYEDVAAPANACRTTRSPIADNVTFLGF